MNCIPFWKVADGENGECKGDCNSCPMNYLNEEADNGTDKPSK